MAGSTGVEDSLQATYLEYEMMEGKNQYRCSKCNKLVDAKKVNIIIIWKYSRCPKLLYTKVSDKWLMHGLHTQIILLLKEHLFSFYF